MRQVDITSSIDASPAYSGSRQRQFASGLSRPRMAGSTPHAKAFGNALAGANQTAANQRMATANLKTSLAGQKARSDDQGVLAGLYAADVGDQVKRRAYGRQLLEEQQQNDASRLAGFMGLMGNTTSLLSGLLNKSNQAAQQSVRRLGRSQRSNSDVRSGRRASDRLAQMMYDAQFM